MKTPIKPDTNTNPKDLELIARCDPSVRRRRAIELQVVRNLIALLIERRFAIYADNGEDAEVKYTGPESEDAFIDTLFAVDEARIWTVHPVSSNRSYVYLVFGNGGWDVISDYGTSLDPAMDNLLTWITEQEEADATSHAH